jgi:hypothetical protein
MPAIAAALKAAAEAVCGREYLFVGAYDSPDQT